MVRWIESDSDELGELLGTFTRTVEVTAEKVADVSADVIGDFAAQLSEEQLSEKYKIPIDNIFMLGNTILGFGALTMIFDAEEIFRMEEMDTDVLKTLFVMAFLIGYRIATDE